MKTLPNVVALLAKWQKHTNPNPIPLIGIPPVFEFES